MILAADVQYTENTGYAAAALFGHWTDAQATRVFTADVVQLPEYQAGQFYRRELPCLLALMEQCPLPISTVVIDGYVTLGQEQKPGLGYKLWETLGSTIPVIGVAKTYFRNTPEQTKVYRHNSKSPLYVTAVGLPLQQAREHILSMHGPYRLEGVRKAFEILQADSVFNLKGRIGI